jgi:hypothetical protein
VFHPRLIETIERLDAGWIRGRFSERPPRPYQTSRRELNLFAFAQANRDHLIWNPVCRVQKISSIRQKDKVANRVAGVERPVDFHHVPKCLGGRFGRNLALP